jgi:hypothetical protein
MQNLSEDQKAVISRGYCPDCDHPGFRLGPRGGAAINIQCMNEQCHARFNVMPWSGVILGAHRIERESDWPTSIAGINVVQGIVALLPDDKTEGLRMLDAARRMVERFKR